MHSARQPSRFSRPALAGVALTAAALLSACGGHGAYTRAALKQSQDRLGAIKAGAEYETARQQFLSGELPKALKTVETSVALAPSVAKTHVLRGRVLLEMGEYEQSLDALAEALKLEPGNIEANFHTAVAFERINRFEDALTHYRACSQSDPNEARFVVAQADMLIEMRRRDEARSMLEAALERFPNSAGVRHSLATVAMLDDLPALASRMLREARLLDPDDVGVLEDLASAELGAGRFAEAEEALRDLLAKDGMEGRRDLKHMRVRCLVEMNRLVDARTALMGLTADRSGEADRQAWLTLGRVALKLNDMPRLRTAASRLMALEPTKPDGRLLMAAWQRRRGDLEGSLRSINAAIELAPRQQEAWVMRGVVLGELGRTDESRESLRTANAMRSDAPSAPLATVIDDSGR